VFGDGTLLVQAFARASPSSWANWRANLAQAFGPKSAQFEQGVLLTRSLNLYDGETGRELRLNGASSIGQGSLPESAV
jgi:hypothetical protein